MMNTSELQRLKMAWLAAREAGDTQAQLQLLREHPQEQAALIEFIAAYHATDFPPVEEANELLPMTQRALQHALSRVFDETTETAAPVGTAGSRSPAFSPSAAAASLTELRKSRNLSKTEAARGLRLSVDVWNKFEAGAIELASLSQRQLDRLSHFFQVSAEQFASLLDASQPAFTLNRRQTKDAAQSRQQGPQKQSFADAIARSSMTERDKQSWLEEQ